MKCPYCGYDATCDEVDIGVGFQQCGPYGCDACHAVQFDWRDEPWPGATEEEKRLGWWKPREGE